MQKRYENNIDVNVSKDFRANGEGCGCVAAFLQGLQKHLDMSCGQRKIDQTPHVSAPVRKRRVLQILICGLKRKRAKLVAALYFRTERPLQGQHNFCRRVPRGGNVAYHVCCRYQ